MTTAFNLPDGLGLRMAMPSDQPFITGLFNSSRAVLRLADAETDYIETLIEHQFDRVGIFTYSHEENTSAHDLVDDVPAAEKQRRAEEIMEVQQEILPIHCIFQIRMVLPMPMIQVLLV